MRRLFKKYSEKTLANQVRLIFILITLFILTLLAISTTVIITSHNNFTNGYYRHIYPLKNLNEIKNIYEINILNTLKEMENGYISSEESKDILILANKLLNDEWKEYKIRSAEDIKDIDIFSAREKNILKLEKTLNNLIDAINLKDNTLVKNIIVKQLHPQTITINYDIDDSIKLEMNDIEEIIYKLNRNIKNTVYYASPFILLFIFLMIKYIKIILTKITLTNEELEKSKHEIISANLLLEEKIELRTKELLEEKNKAEDAAKAKSYFLANMSHEIRTPMNGIIGMAHIALKTNLNNKQQNCISKIQSSANSLLGIINDILDISKIEAGKLQIEKTNFDLFKVVESVINLIELKAYEKNIDIIVDYDPTIGKKFYGDTLRLNQILLNLLSNAVKFTQEGEIILTMSNGSSENKILFEIIDSGIGLSENQISKIFESFTQADLTTTKKYGGTGLGLSITKQLVELMNGKIWVTSEIGVGSKFSFEIELSKFDNKVPYTMFNGKKVLIVDDCKSWLTILEHLMISFGLDVNLAQSGKEAISILEKDPHSYDLILIDWNMPELDGIETCKIIKENLNIDSKKIILISAYSLETIKEGIEEAQIDKYIHKPVNPSALNDALCEIFLNKLNTKKIKVNHDKKNLQNEIKKLKGSHILLVEDNETNKEIIISLLEDSGIKIDTASNGFEAVRKVEDNDYELVFMDIQMPVMDGYEATKEIRNSNKEIPIIALTANAMKDSIEKTLSAGMNRHLNKPIEVEKLYQTLLDFISKKVNFEEELFQSTENQETILPDFETIDKEYGLNLVLGMVNVYIKTLHGLVKYKDLNFENMEEEEFKRTIHSLKGISASAGALKVTNLALKIEEEENTPDLLNIFKKELKKVIDEIETKLQISNNNTIVQLKNIGKKERDELFINLKISLISKRPKKIKDTIKELEKYKLNENDTLLIKDIKEKVEKFKFKEAIGLL